MHKHITNERSSKGRIEGSYQILRKEGLKVTSQSANSFYILHCVCKLSIVLKTKCGFIKPALKRTSGWNPYLFQSRTRCPEWAETKEAASDRCRCNWACFWLGLLSHPGTVVDLVSLSDLEGWWPNSDTFPYSIRLVYIGLLHQFLHSTIYSINIYNACVRFCVKPWKFRRST